MKQRLRSRVRHTGRASSCSTSPWWPRPEGASKTRLGTLAAEGVTIFLSTHSLAVAEEVGGRIGIIDRGRLVALGSLDELRAQAKTAAGAERTNGRSRTSLDILAAQEDA
jgi:ABC-type multidrug transport system ATPase subunit